VVSAPKIAANTKRASKKYPAGVKRLERYAITLKNQR